MSKEMLDELKAKGLTNIASLLEDTEETVVVEDEVVSKSAIEEFATTLELTEAQVQTLKDIFEAAVTEKALVKATALEESVKEQMAALEEAQDKHITNYLDFVVEGWVEKNALAVASHAKVEIAESFLTQLKGLFDESGLVLESDEKIDAIAAAQAETVSVKSELQEAVEKLAEARQEVFAGKLHEIVKDLSEGMVETDKERFAALAEELELNEGETLESIKARLVTLKEAFIKAPAKEETTTEVQEAETSVDDDLNLEEKVEIKEEITPAEKQVDPKMASYVAAIKQSFSARNR
jgi:hypothetical protein